MCEVEHVCSGPGLKNIYDFVCHLRGIRPDVVAPAEVDCLIGDRCCMTHSLHRSLPVLCQNRATCACQVCAFFFKFWFVLNVLDSSVLLIMFYFWATQGAECSSAALRSLATGGVYIAGGIPSKILPLLTEDSTLTDAFQMCNPPMRDLFVHFPLMVVNEPNVGLLGAKVRFPQNVQPLSSRSGIDASGSSNK